MIPADVELLPRRLVAGAIVFEDEPPLRVAVPMEVGPLLDLVGVLFDIAAGAFRLSLAGVHVADGVQHADARSLRGGLQRELTAVLRGLAE